MVTSDSSDSARELQHFSSGGQEIRVETFGAGARDNRPTLLMLHGARGVAFANRFIAGLAQHFAGDGYVVHLVHYFDRTGTTLADEDAIQRFSTHWLETVADAVDWAQRERPEVKVGIFGFSLGGYLAAAESVSRDRISAAVILSGGLDEMTAQAVRHAPPTLILHGGGDRRVPLSEAQRLERALQKAGGKPQIKVYPAQGHIMSPPAYADVMQRAMVFLRAQLAPARRR